MDVFNLVKKYWPALFVIAIVALGTYVRTDDYSKPYLRNIDSYAFTRQIDEISKLGYLPGHDSLMLAPDGMDKPVGRDLYVYIMGFSFDFLRIFFPGYTLFSFLIWAPALMAALMAVPMYYIGKILYDKRAGVLAAFFVVFDISILSRTLGADPDNDCSVLLFPLIAVALFLIAYKHVSEKGFDHRGMLYTILAGLGLGTWYYVWSGYWFVVWLLAGFIGLKVILKILGSRRLSAIKDMKRTILMFCAIMVIFFALTVPVFGFKVIPETIQGPFSFGDIKSENRDFPNVFVSVAELQSGGSIQDILARTNVFFLSFMVLSLGYLATSALMRKKEHIDALLLLLIWFVGPLIATSIGVRFSILFAAPIAIGAAIFISKVFRIIEGEHIGD